MQNSMVARRVGMPVFGQRGTAAIGSGVFRCESGHGKNKNPKMPFLKVAAS